ncbi:Importin alpha-3 subunit [Aphelenchoides bicaudatus]|nr:Importin alpha-3 subunit [Aphelenchoides bicaudatus]
MKLSIKIQFFILIFFLYAGHSRAFSIFESTKNDELFPQTLDDFVKEAEDDDPVVRLGGVTKIRNMLSSDKSPPIKHVIDSGILPILVDYLESNDTQLQFESAWALTNIASGNNDQTKAVVDAGAVPIFIRLLSSNDSKVVEQAVWALGNIIGDGPYNREICIRAGVVDPLIQLVQPKIPIKFLRNLNWVLQNLCRGNDSTLPADVVTKLLPVFRQLLQHKDPEVLQTSLWALTYIGKQGSERIQMIVDADIIPHAVPLLSHKNTKVLTAAISFAGEIATGTDVQTQILLDENILDYVSHLLWHPDENINKVAMWLLSNVAAGDVYQLQAIIDANLLPTIIEFLTIEDYSTRKEAVWTVANFATKGNNHQLKELLDNGVVVPLCSMLQASDTKMVELVLETLNNILTELPEQRRLVLRQLIKHKQLEVIEELKSDNNTKVHAFAIKLLDKLLLISKKKEKSYQNDTAFQWMKMPVEEMLL